MRTVVVYESMFGNTRAIAEAIAEGLGTGSNVQVIGVTDADRNVLDGADLVIVGGPTHAWGMSRPNTRKGAPAYVRKPGSGLVLESDADTGLGVREWLASLGQVHASAAGFDTRIKAPAVFTGRASPAIVRQLSRHGLTVVTGPKSFFVSRKSHLLAGEPDRARDWGARLAAMVAPRTRA
jgi:hypothetical protein